MQKFYSVSLLMQKGNHVGNCGSIVQADSESDSIERALKKDDVIALFRDGYRLVNPSAYELSPHICPSNSGFDVYYVNLLEMLCIKTNALSPESIETILSATNLNKSLQAELWSAITEGK